MDVFLQLMPPASLLQSSSSPSNGSGGGGAREQLEEAAQFLVLEWAEKLFSQKAHSVRELAHYLMDKMFVDTSSPAAQTLMAASTQHVAWRQKG